MTKHYAICENMCLEEVYSKKEMDEKMSDIVIVEIEVKGAYGYGQEYLENFEAGNIADYYVKSVMIEDPNRHIRYTEKQPVVSTNEGNIKTLDVLAVKLRDSSNNISVEYHFDTQVSQSDPVTFKVMIVLQNKKGAKKYEYAG